MNKLAIINSPIYPMITSLVNLFGLKTKGIGGVKLSDVGYYSAQQESNVLEQAIKLK
ncbi:hypothetical protein [Butyricimonas virosa]|uniref:hypothetical protein n=1 Tax=Butyricimonas virosa TaxID=544645 RepID=UPI003D06EDA8